LFLCFIKCLQTERNCYFFFDFPHCQRGLVNQNSPKTKWVLMRLDATTLTEKNKSAILNIQKRNKTLPSEKKNKFSLL
jgi:hypothetical protein